MENLFCLLTSPNTQVTDTGPSFSSELLGKFMKKWDIVHVNSSMLYQSNGETGHAVQTVNDLMHTVTLHYLIHTLPLICYRKGEYT